MLLLLRVIVSFSEAAKVWIRSPKIQKIPIFSLTFYSCFTQVLIFVFMIFLAPPQYTGGIETVVCGDHSIKTIQFKKKF